ncbi:MAG: ParB/RepB/Spo0J family partition protein [Omnitrophica WOR_2 bacterium]
MARKTGLGRGLDALIPANESYLPEGGISQIPVENIHSNPRQPRTKFDAEELSELVQSILEHGIIQPLILTQGSQPDDYILIAGERRLMAARQAGLKSVPAIIREASEQQLVELALVENVQRADLSPLEAAEAFRQLAEDFALSHEEIAIQVGKNRVTVTNTLRLLKLPEAVKQALAERRISEGHARALLALPTPQAQEAALQAILRNELNVRQTEELVRKLTGQKPERLAKPVSPPEIAALEERLRNHLGTRVNLHHGRKGGSVVIYYYSQEELDNLVDIILREK